MKIHVAMLFCAAVLLAGCQPAVVQSSDESIQVATTLFPLYEFASEVGGDLVAVEMIIPPGTEPHSFDPRPSDIVLLESTDVFVYNGAGMEPWAQDILDGLTNQELIGFEASKHVQLIESSHDHSHDEHADEHHDESEHVHGNHSDESHFENHDVHANESHDESEHVHDDHSDESSHDHHDHGAYDPHIWLSFENNQDVVTELAAVFAQIDPTNADVYFSNAQEYNLQLQALDAAYRDALSTCMQNKVLVGGHNFMGYLEKEYGIESISAIEEFEPHSEPTPSDMQKISDVAAEYGIQYILSEVLVSQQVADAIASEVGAQVLTFSPASNIAKEDFNTGVSFVDVMQENLGVLQIALECE